MKKKYKLKVLQIETTNICNANCKFCIHSSIKKFGTMSDKLFKKILLDARGIKSLTTIIPMLLGEPLCDKKIIKRLQLINEILPSKSIHLFTNGSLLTPSLISKLIKIDNLFMHFSLNGMNKETRKELMELDDYDYVVDMINLYQKTGKPFEVLLVAHPSISDGDLKKFKEFNWKTKLVKYGNWSGDKFKGTKATFCSRAISEMTIMYDGRVNLCCMEYGKVIFGDVNNSTVREIWESTHRQMYCEAHSFGKYLLGVCADCNYSK